MKIGNEDSRLKWFESDVHAYLSSLRDDFDDSAVVDVSEVRTAVGEVQRSIAKLGEVLERYVTTAATPGRSLRDASEA